MRAQVHPCFIRNAITVRDDDRLRKCLRGSKMRSDSVGLTGSCAMRLSTVACYLIGDRAAILSLGADRSTPLLGAVLVLSAGLARSYHTADLLDQPWHLLTPFAVSSAMAVVLLLTTYIGPRESAVDESRQRGKLAAPAIPLVSRFVLDDSAAGLALWNSLRTVYRSPLGHAGESVDFGPCRRLAGRAHDAGPVGGDRPKCRRQRSFTSCSWPTAWS